MATEETYKPLVPDQTLLNSVKLSARDFSSIADELLRLLKIEYANDYNDYASTSQGIMLRDLVAWAYAALSWYMDRTASDTYLATARTGAAVERIVEQIAYKMGPASAASARLVLTFPNGTTKGFVMKERWKYSGPGGLYFESYAKVTQANALNPGDTLNVDVRQGETRTLTFTSDGSKNQTYRLASIDEGRHLGVGLAEVWVDSVSWTENDFLTYDKTNQFEVSYLANPPIVRFGHGSAGNIPPQGAEVKIRFVIIDGKNGNVKSDTINTSVDSLVIDGQTVEFTVTNPEKASGGDDPEDIDRAKRFAPVSFAARGAAITQQDYEALSGSFKDPAYGSVAKSYAVNPRTSYEDVVFNEIVADSEDLLSDFNNLIGGIKTEIASLSTSLTPLLNSLSATSESLQTLRDGIVSLAGAALSSARGARESCVNGVTSADSVVYQADISKSTLTSLEDWVNANITTTSDREHLLEQIGIAKLASGNASNDGTTASTSANEAKGALEDIVIPNLSSVSDSLADGGDMDEWLQLIESDQSFIGVIVSGQDGIQEKVSEISVLGSVLYDDVNAKLDLMQERIGDLFSDDCLSNYVQVPILALDSEGNYTSPSIGLRVGLQQYLNTVKEVTQVVEVVDGSSVLVPAVIDVQVKILKSYVPAEVISQIRSVITKAMKGRNFNQPLYLSEPDTGLGLYDLMSGIDGIDYVNVNITGPAQYLNNGNLVPGESQVIFLDSLNIQNLDEVV